MNQVIDLLKHHRSIRKFKTTPIAEEQEQAIIMAACHASTSNFIQAFTIIKVTDPAVRHRIATLAGPQPWVDACPLFLVFCADLARAESACGRHHKKMEKGSMEQFIIATVDVALAAQNAMIAAESLGLGGVYIGGIRNDPDTVCQLLNIPDDVYPVFGMCIGHPDEAPEKKPRLPLDIVYKKDGYHTRGEVSLMDSYDNTCNAYYIRRDKNARDETWTGQIAQMMEKPLRPHMKGFLNKRGFGIR